MIGAGAAGLSALRHFTSKPDCFNVTAFELHDRIGGTWTYTDQVGFNQYGIRIHSSMYKNLRFVRDPCFVLLGKIFRIAFFQNKPSNGNNGVSGFSLQLSGLLCGS